MFGLFLDLKTKCNIFCNGHMGKERIFLEHSIELPSVGRQLVDVLPVKNDISGIRSLETTQNPKQCGLATAAWTEQCQKFIFTDIKI